MSQTIVSSVCPFTASQQNSHCPAGDVCAPFILLAALSSTWLLAPAPLAPLFLHPPLHQGAWETLLCHRSPRTGMPRSCQGNLEQSACNFSQRVCAHNMNGNDFLSIDGQGGREGGKEENKEGGSHKSVKLQTNLSPYPCPLPSPTLSLSSEVRNQSHCEWK